MYKLDLTRATLKQLRKFELETFTRLFNGLARLAKEPFSEDLDVRKLADSTDFYRLRIGDYRVIYQLYPDDNRIVVKSIAHRRDVYK